MPTVAGTELAPYLPIELLRAWADAGEPGDGVAFDAVTLTIDIADSTGLTDRFSATGLRGAETLGGLLSDYFANLATIVEMHGGIVARIAGDALAAVWPAGQNTAAAARSAIAAADAVREIPARLSGELSHRIAIDFGELNFQVLGPAGGRRFPLVSGAPLRAMAPGPLRGEPGQLRVSSHVVQLSGRQAEEPKPAPLVTPNSSSAGFDPSDFVPPVVLSHITAGLGEWMAEFRTLSVVYVGLIGLSLIDIKRAFSLIDGVARHAGAAVWDVIDEDKGVVVKIIFGLPPFATETDSAGALDVAHRAGHALRAAGLAAGIGVATGQAFCGEVGSHARREHIAVGPVMNYGARLMQAAGGAVLCDQATARAANGSFEFGDPITLTVRGRSLPLEARRVIRPAHEANAAPRINNVSPPVGRDSACRLIDERIATLVNSPASSVIIRGEAGVGKTCLLDYAERRARGLGVSVVWARGARTERNTAFHVLRSSLAGLLTLDPRSAGEESTLQHIKRLLAENGPDARLDLLDDIFPGPGAGGTNENLVGGARRSILQDLIVRLFHRMSRSSSILLVVDDLQWVDAASREMLSAVSARSPRVLVVMGARSPSGGEDIACASLNATDTDIVLDRLSGDDAAALICARFGIARLPARLSAFVQERSGGLPIHVEQLALSMFERGALTVVNGRCEIAPGALTGDSAPDGLRGLITERIDRLDPFDQLTAKVASVIGPRFDFEALRAAHPSSPVPERLVAALGGLATAGFIEPEGGQRYVFRHALFRETFYELIPFSRRAPLHASVALRIEARDPDEAGVSHAQLAWHWEQAGNINKAIDRRAEAAWAALRAHAMADALEQAAHAERIARETGQELSLRQQVRLERIWADALQGLAKFDEAGRHFEACASHAGLKIPRSSVDLTVALAAEGLRQMLTRLGLGRNSVAEAQLEYDRLAAHIYMRLAEHAYFSKPGLALMQRTLASLNHAERCGSPIEMTLGYAGLAVGLSVAGMTAPAKSYADRAILLAREHGGPHDQGVAHMLATVALFPSGHWQTTADYAAVGAALFASVGDEFRRQTCTVLLAYAHLARGNHALARQSLRAVPDGNSDIEAASVRAWTAACSATLDLILKEPVADATADLEACLAGQLSEADRLVCLGPLAEARLAAGDRDGALQCLRDALELIQDSPPALGICFISLPRIAEACIALDQLQWARSVVRTTLAFARNARIVRPHGYYTAGLLQAHRGRLASARSHWRRGLLEG